VGEKMREDDALPENYQVMHVLLFPHLIQHAENLGGEIDEAANRRGIIGPSFQVRRRGDRLCEGWSRFYQQSSSGIARSLADDS